jgi:hypothetical protein
MDRQPWHRRETESAKAFHAFMLYRDMLPRERSIQKVLDNADRKPSYYRHLARWSSRYDWVNRANLHDDHMAEARAEAQEKAIVDMVERQTKQAMALQTLGLRKYLNADGSLKETVVLQMADRDAIRAIVEGAKLERISRGQPGDITKHEIEPASHKPLEEMTDAELDEIIERRGALPEGKE